MKLSVKRWLTSHTVLLCLLIIGVACFMIDAPLLAAPDAVNPTTGVDMSAPPAPASQTREDAHRKSIGCMSCHTSTDQHTMHANPAVILGCTDCHGGNATPGLLMRKAHIAPRHGEWWPGSANATSYTPPAPPTAPPSS